MSFLGLLYLYLCFRLKHFLCDFIQPEWVILNKKSKFFGIGGRALLLHAGVHGLGTLLIALIFAPYFWWLAIVDIFVHGGIDRVKSRLNHRYGWTPKDKRYWLAFGLDQEAHNLTHLAFIVVIFLNAGANL